MVSFLKSLGIVLGLFIFTSLLAAISPTASFWVAVALILLPIIALIKPLPKLWLGHRGFSLAVLLVVGLPAAIATQGILTEQNDARLAELKASDPATYLVELQKVDEDRWLEELKIMDPERHTQEVARIAEERVRGLEEERARQTLEAAELRQRECGERNETGAYIMSQHYVKQQLRAPSTADFPWAHEISTLAIGDCKFKINAYVDAQNGFGAMLRTRYSAIMIYYPEEESWNALELNMSE